MLTACGHSPTKLAGPAPDPVIKTTRVVETRCPAELDNPPPARVSLPAGAVVEGNEAGMTYMTARYRREFALEALITDARQACPKSGH